MVLKAQCAPVAYRWYLHGWCCCDGRRRTGCGTMMITDHHRHEASLLHQVHHPIERLAVDRGRAGCMIGLDDGERSVLFIAQCKSHEVADYDLNREVKLRTVIVLRCALPLTITVH